MNDFGSLKIQYLSKMTEWQIAFTTANRLEHQASILRKNLIKATKTKIMDGKIFITFNENKYELEKIGERGDFPLYRIMKNKRVVLEAYWGSTDDVRLDIVMEKL